VLHAALSTHSNEIVVLNGASAPAGVRAALHLTGGSFAALSTSLPARCALRVSLCLLCRSLQLRVTVPDATHVGEQMRARGSSGAAHGRSRGAPGKHCTRTCTAARSCSHAHCSRACARGDLAQASFREAARVEEIGIRSEGCRTGAAVPCAAHSCDAQCIDEVQSFPARPDKEEQSPRADRTGVSRKGRRRTRGSENQRRMQFCTGPQSSDQVHWTCARREANERSESEQGDGIDRVKVRRGARARATW